MAKTCPLCRTEMVTSNVDSLALDRCESCGGVWFDTRELREYGKKLGLGRLPRKPRGRSSQVVEGLACPNCVSATLARTEHGQLTLYGCRACQGWFLGGAEMGHLQRRYRDRLLADGLELDSDDPESEPVPAPGLVGTIRGFFFR